MKAAEESHKRKARDSQLEPDRLSPEIGIKSDRCCALYHRVKDGVLIAKSSKNRRKASSEGLVAWQTASPSEAVIAEAITWTR